MSDTPSAAAPRGERRRRACEAARQRAVSRPQETSTSGLRDIRVGKRAGRRVRAVTVGGQEIRVKTALLDGGVVDVQPEFHDLVSNRRRRSPRSPPLSG